MIGVSKLYCGSVEPHDALRYGTPGETPAGRATLESGKPVVVWNVTRRCNLRCVHCYSASDAGVAPDELSTSEAEAMIDDLAAWGAPVLLFSGGEPMARQDLLPLVRRASAAGIRTAMSTNGTLLDERSAGALKDAGLGYAGISLDGLRETHDRFRGADGCFERMLAGVEACRRVGLKVGFRLTITKRNFRDMPGVFRLLAQMGVPRICFYHLVYSGRGAELREEDIDHAAARETIDRIIDETARLHADGFPAEVLTVDNHADGVFLLRRLERENPAKAAAALALLRRNGGNASGRRIACVSWDGTIHPDQFWRTVTVGNVRRQPFSETWTSDHPLLAALRNRRELLGGKCGRCGYVDICNGNMRVRAEAVHGDPWAEDPACYLTEEEIAERLPPTP
ncbi:MAG: radical SAM protein [Myxococcota bacterium]|nr:radical SAM protein [Myxococcota bacterium]